jgi:hypothetical protein
MSEIHQLLFEDGICHAGPDGEIRGDTWSITWQQLRGGLADGVRVVTLTNGPLSVLVCPTRGMGVLSAEYGELTLGWTSPVAGPVHPRYVDQSARNGLGWLDGFSELICRCGLAFNGPPGVDEGATSPIESQLTLHGRIANTPADSVEVGYDEAQGEAWIRGVCREATLFGPHLELTSRLSLSADARSLSITDEVANLASTPTELELLYHINVGPPFLGAGSTFRTMFENMSPRDSRAAEDVETYDTYLPPTPAYAEQVYYFAPLVDDHGRTTALLANAGNDLGVSVQFDPRQLPCLSQWKCTQPEADGYVTGIEPGTNFPNFKAFERQQQRVLTLAPGGTHRVDLQLGVHPDAAAVKEVADKVAAVQSQAAPTIHPTPALPLAPT